MNALEKGATGAVLRGLQRASRSGGRSSALEAGRAAAQSGPRNGTNAKGPATKFKSGGEQPLRPARGGDDAGSPPRMFRRGQGEESATPPEGNGLLPPPPRAVLLLAGHADPLGRRFPFRCHVSPAYNPLTETRFEGCFGEK